MSYQEIRWWTIAVLEIAILVSSPFLIRIFYHLP